MIPIDHNQVACMAEAVYHEARGEPKLGQTYVAKVILNRTRHDGFPDDVCSVVKQPGQFTYKHNKKIVDKTSYELAYEVAAHVMYQDTDDSISSDLLYYHNASVRPRWTSKSVRFFKKVGNHVFYRRVS